MVYGKTLKNNVTNSSILPASVKKKCGKYSASEKMKSTTMGTCPLPLKTEKKEERKKLTEIENHLRFGKHVTNRETNPQADLMSMRLGGHFGQLEITPLILHLLEAVDEFTPGMFHSQ